MQQSELLLRAAALNVADIGSVDRRCVLRGLHRVAGDRTLAGFARTARAVPGDADSVHASVLAAVAGEVVVVDYGGPEVEVAGIGDLIAAEAKRRRLAGIVVWGPARDLDGLAEIGVPVFATGVTPAAGYHEQLGELQVEIEVGGVRISPGDLIVGDADGLVAVARAEAEAVVERAEEIHARDRDLIRRVLAGEPLAELPELQAYQGE